MRIKILSLMIASTALCLSGCKNSSGNSTPNTNSSTNTSESDYSEISLSNNALNKIILEANENVFEASEIYSYIFESSNISHLYGDFLFLLNQPSEVEEVFEENTIFGKDGYIVNYEEYLDMVLNGTKYSEYYDKGKSTYFLSSERTDGTSSNDGYLDLLCYDEYSPVKGVAPYCNSYFESNYDLVSVDSTEEDFSKFVDSYICDNYNFFVARDYEGFDFKVEQSKNGDKMRISLDVTFNSYIEINSTDYACYGAAQIEIYLSIKEGKYYYTSIKNTADEYMTQDLFGNAIPEEENVPVRSEGYSYRYTYGERKNIKAPVVKVNPTVDKHLVLTEFDSNGAYTNNYYGFDYNTLFIKDIYNIGDPYIVLRTNLNPSCMYSLAYEEDVLDSNCMKFADKVTDNPNVSIVESTDMDLISVTSSFSEVLIKVTLEDDFETIKSISVTPYLN